MAAKGSNEVSQPATSGGAGQVPLQSKILNQEDLTPFKIGPA